MDTLTKAPNPKSLSRVQESKIKATATYPLSMRLVRFAFSTLGRLFPRKAGQIAFRLFSTPRQRARHKVSDPILEKAQIFDILYGGQLLKGYQWGESDRTILLVHGWESRGTALRSFVPGLLEQGFQVVAFDAPAHGNSDGKQTNLPDFSGAVRAVINRLGGVYGIIAHSFGGASTVFTLANLDNTIAVERLVLVASPSNLSRVLSNFLKMVNAPRLVADQFWQIISNKLKVNIAEADVSQMSTRVKVDQLLVVHDREDRVVPISEGQTVAKNWPGAQLFITEGSGHFQLMKNKEVINRIVQFIDS